MAALGYGGNNLFSFTIDFKEVEGLARVAQVAQEEWFKSFKGINTYMLRVWAENSEIALRASIKRPQESGLREGPVQDVSRSRMTGRFTFGRTGGGAFIGVPIESINQIYGFGYPNIRHADQATGGIWRVLEYGLGARSIDTAMSKGDHLMPFPDRRLRFQNIFMPVSTVEQALEKGAGRGPGLEPKRFIEAGAEIVEREIPRFYDKEWRDKFLGTWHKHPGGKPIAG